MRDVSTFDTFVYLMASRTLPIGMKVTAFPDDVDPLQFPEVNIGEVLLDLNGRPISISRGEAIPVRISVLAGTTNDSLLSTIWNANRACNFSAPAKDEITLVLRYPDKTTKIFSKGAIVAGPASFDAQSSGRAKSSTYGFAFGDVSNLSVSAAVNAALSALF